MEGIKDEFEGFGEGFEGFPKRLPDDCVEYSLYIIDAKLKTNRERLVRLEAVRKEAQKLTGNLLKEYIWQREVFKLEVESKDGQMYLHGLTSYGDSVEDEWLIVYLLRELSKTFEDLWIRVVDTDGEFLLIEAANALPRWLNPEIADNRVWIHKDQLRIIPLTPSSQSTSEVSAISRNLSFDEALKIITLSPSTAFNSPMIEEEAFFRLRNYPSQIAQSLHYTKVTIPRKLAYILHHLPASIAPAVEAFYLRDPISLKPLQSASSKLLFAPEDLVTVSAKLTRVLFAQIKAQHFPPPTTWVETFASSEKQQASLETASQLETGMKLTCGYEMLITDPKNKDNRHVREIGILLDDLDPEAGESLPTDVEIATWPNINRQDDEKWMDINFEDFDNELQGKRGGRRSDDKKPRSAIPGAFGPDPPPGFGDPKTHDEVRKMVERFEAFLNDDEAGIDGVEDLDEMDFDDDGSDSDDEDEDEDKELSFDEEEFARMMREMMGLPPAEGLEPEKKTKRKAAQGLHSDEEEEESTDEDEDEEREIRKLMENMESELREAGALNLDPTPKKLAALKGKAVVAESASSSSQLRINGADKVNNGVKKEDDEESEEESEGDLDIDFTLAKNMLDSIKSQAGMAGPGGNMLAMMGMVLPRDTDDEDDALPRRR